MNGQDAVNGFTSERVTKTGSAQILTEAGFDSSADNRLTLADCQPIDTDLFYDLCIRNQTLLWKALPKPPNSSQVCLIVNSTKIGYVVAIFCFLVGYGRIFQDIFGKA